MTDNVGVTLGRRLRAAATPRTIAAFALGLVGALVAGFFAGPAVALIALVVAGTVAAIVRPGPLGFLAAWLGGMAIILATVIAYLVTRPPVQAGEDVNVLTYTTTAALLFGVTFGGGALVVGAIRWTIDWRRVRPPIED